MAKEVKNGDVIRVLAGEDIPIDGIIIQGETSINQAVMTGESIPVDKKEGDSVYSGTTNCFGVIEIKANKDYSDSSIQKLVNLVKEAQNNKAPTERIVDKYARVIIPLAIVFAFLVYIVTGEVSRAVTVLVVFCPCSLFLATPTSIVASIAHAAKNNIIVKTGEALEIVGKCDVFAFDKTGTLTEGKLSVSEIEEIANENKDEILRLIASSELKSEHPIGRCIVEYAKVNNINIQSPEDFKMSAGRGIYAKVEGKKIHAGNEKFMEDNGIELSSEIKKKINSKRLEGKIALIVSVNSVVSAIITLSDTIRKSATGAIEELNNLSKTLLLTGDNSFTAEYFAKKIGIQSFQSNMLPKEKASYIEKLQKEGKSVCMTGDGINDAVALKVADVGISMGTFGSDMAIESSDIIITGDNLQKISYLRKLSKICIKTIKVNIIFAMSVNVISLTLSALGMLVPATGAIVHNIISILVVLNAALIYDKKIV